MQVSFLRIFCVISSSRTFKLKESAEQFFRPATDISFSVRFCFCSIQKRWRRFRFCSVPVQRKINGSAGFRFDTPLAAPRTGQIYRHSVELRIFSSSYFNRRIEFAEKKLSYKPRPQHACRSNPLGKELYTFPDLGFAHFVPPGWSAKGSFGTKQTRQYA